MARRKRLNVRRKPLCVTCVTAQLHERVINGNTHNFAYLPSAAAAAVVVEGWKLSLLCNFFLSMIYNFFESRRRAVVQYLIKKGPHTHSLVSLRGSCWLWTSFVSPIRCLFHNDATHCQITRCHCRDLYIFCAMRLHLLSRCVSRRCDKRAKRARELILYIFFHVALTWCQTIIIICIIIIMPHRYGQATEISKHSSTKASLFSVSIEIALCVQLSL
jgi:hypothetical protein